MRSALLEELPLNVVRVAECDHRQLTGPVQVYSVGDGPDAPQGEFHVLESLGSPGDADCNVIDADAALVETVVSWGPGQRTAQHQSGACLPNAIPKLPKVWEILVEVELGKGRVEGLGAAKVVHSKGYVVEADEHAATLRPDRQAGDLSRQHRARTAASADGSSLHSGACPKSSWANPIRQFL